MPEIVFTEAEVGTYTVPHSITEQHIHDIMCCVLEDGCSDRWVMHLTKNVPETLKVPYADWATLQLISGCPLYFKETKPESKMLALTLQKLIEGIHLNAKNRPFDWDLNDIDSKTADCILQYALFGELLYV